MFGKNIKYKCNNARVVKCTSNEMVCHVVELKGEYGWMPYTVTGDLSNAIIAISKLYNEKIKTNIK